MNDHPLSLIIVENILENLTAGLLTLNPDGRISYANPSASRILGYPPHFFDGKGWVEAFFQNNIHSDSNDDFNQVLLDVVYEKKIGLKRTVWYANPSGQRMFLSLTTSFLRDGTQAAGVVVLIEDLTEMYLLHENEKRTLRNMHRIEKERSESLKQFAMALAHQIRNPVMSIGGFAQRLRARFQPLNRELRYLDYILSGAQRLESLLQAVKEYTACQQINPEMSDFNAILKDLRLRLQERAEYYLKSIEWNIACGAEKIYADQPLLVRALYEIGLNAIEFCTEKRVSIALTSSLEHEELSIRISDCGPGIEGRLLPFVFDPFFTTKAAGMGLGLCKAEVIVTAHGGEITLESSEGKGVSVSIRLPCRAS